MKLYTYAENCVMAGSVFHGDPVNENGEPNGDLVEHEGTEDELIEWARTCLQDARYSAYRRKVAKNILEYLRPGEYGWNGEPATVNSDDEAEFDRRVMGE